MPLPQTDLKDGFVRGFFAETKEEPHEHSGGADAAVRRDGPDLGP